MEILNQSQKALIIEAAEHIIGEDFTSNPGWNFPPDSVKRFVLRMEGPDGEGDIEIYILIARAESENDELW